MSSNSNPQELTHEVHTQEPDRHMPHCQSRDVQTVSPMSALPTYSCLAWRIVSSDYLNIAFLSSHIC